MNLSPTGQSIDILLTALETVLDQAPQSWGAVILRNAIKHLAYHTGHREWPTSLPE